ncbi:MAG TPA: rod shape-determining protein MreC [Thermoleophilaceae bacterium]|jgi:rod shape-determining protein MreC|nr:rod shape-determining protein MreC [Thermoleophilaceae bacterium]
MYDRKAVRRRRAVLAVFIALSIGILTAYFGESGGGFLHALQRGAQETFAPIESGASRALKPVRDLVGWAGDTFEAKDRNDELEQEVDRLRSQLARSQTAQRDAEQLKGLVDLPKLEGYPQGTAPVTARVIARSPTVWYSKIKIDKGSSDGVELNQPVVAASAEPQGGTVGGLAGKVTSVTGGSAEVTLITDASIGVGAQVMPAGAAGIVRPEVGDPRDLLLDFVEGGRRVTENTTVVTSGFRTDEGESLFPRGIPIGRVVDVDLDELEIYSRVHIRPFADLKRIDIVQVLTRRPRGAQTAEVSVP